MMLEGGSRLSIIYYFAASLPSLLRCQTEDQFLRCPRTAGPVALLSRTGYIGPLVEVRSCTGYERHKCIDVHANRFL